MIKSIGYMIQDKQGYAIYAVGMTVSEAWSKICDIGPFFDAFGNDVHESIAYETQFKTYGATANLIAQVENEGGQIGWHIIDGVGCTIAEFEQNSK